MASEAISLVLGRTCGFHSPRPLDPGLQQVSVMWPGVIADIYHLDFCDKSPGHRERHTHRREFMGLGSSAERWTTPTSAP
jgi:hypothetical protein